MSKKEEKENSAEKETPVESQSTRIEYVEAKEVKDERGRVEKKVDSLAEEVKGLRDLLAPITNIFKGKENAEEKEESGNGNDSTPGKGIGSFFNGNILKDKIV